MRKNALLATILFLTALASAQLGTAPNGYYPINYNGSVFTGTVTETNPNEIVLSFEKQKSTETFHGQLVNGCSVPTADGSSRKMMPADIPKGTEMTVLFNPETMKADGNKITENMVIGIVFDTWQGQKIPESKKRIHWCVEGSVLRFKAFH
jgi:hypothetical protein